MSLADLVVAVLVGIVQGIVEWLPVSSQGNLSLFLTVVGVRPAVALQLALFLQLGTTVSAAIYFREDIGAAFEAVPAWRPQTAFVGPNAITSFVVVACIVTGIVGIPLYVAAVDVASELAGGAFIAVIGVLLVFTGILQLAAESVDFATKSRPTLGDAIIVGALQGVAILPGVSRSGVTIGGLLFRAHEGPSAFRLSFLLSIPAGIGAAFLTVVGTGGVPGISVDAAILALLTSAVVGYVTIGALMRFVERVPFWLVCFGIGGLAIVGGGIVTVV